MKSSKKTLHSVSPPKAPTGIAGLDEITRGGLARGRTTLLAGGVGSGKSLLALQVLVNGARTHNEPGIFVAFEENSNQIIGNSGKFGWNLPALQRKNLFFLNAQPTTELIQSGTFDLDGLLAVLAAKAEEMGAKRIVFDAIDVVLSLLDDRKVERKEIYKLHEWLLAHNLTAIITAKADGDEENERHLSFIQFMVDCAIQLKQEVVAGISQRNLRIKKYRGSAFEENESPFVIGEHGLDVAGARDLNRKDAKVSNERVSSGVERLDKMLGGGYYRCACILITGLPGTAKSTLAGAFAEAACQRGERTLYINFDSDVNEFVRNLSSVSIRLQRFLKSGMLQAMSARTMNGSAEIHLMRIKNMACEHKARCLVVDPLSALARAGNEGTSNAVAERLIDWAKAEGITMLCTSLLDSKSLASAEGTPIKISTLADTWIHMSYLVNAGERNRGLSIIKSRGTGHSNQVRELILSDKGVTLADAYMAGGEVLMGTLRWEKELALRDAKAEAEKSTQRQRLKIESEEAELAARIKLLQVELEMKRVEKNLLVKSAASGATESSQNEKSLRTLRKADSINLK
jgi:circadian clock protein KaiC